MKLTKRTIPQARNFQCDKCKAIRCHKEMYNDEICEDCYTEEQRDTEGLIIP
jgi:hypothetical protein